MAQARRWGQHIQCLVRLGQEPLVAVRNRPERTTRFGRLGQHLVVNIGDVADQGDLVSGQQPPAEDVIVDASAGARMRARLHSQPAQVGWSVRVPAATARLPGGSRCRTGAGSWLRRIGHRRSVGGMVDAIPAPPPGSNGSAATRRSAGPQPADPGRRPPSARPCPHLRKAVRRPAEHD